ncbi:MAG TPA: pyridoxal phosphate-dependent aminotransferase family protein [Candidatus Deferrimicrobiaceae bacterium]
MPNQPGLMNKVSSFKTVDELKAAGIYPYFREISSAQDPVITIGGRQVVMMGSNGYLGLTNHPYVKKAAIRAIEKYGTGCAGSRFLNGTLDIHRELEEELADLVGKESALVFSTGYQTNVGTISSLVRKGEYAVTDKMDHASIVDGCQLSLGKMVRFEHNDVIALENLINRLPAEKGKLVIVDGVFSMEGDIAPLPEIARICRASRSVLMVDDAHGIGVLGKNGAGTADHFGVTGDVHVIMGTFSKSLATVGGFIASDRVTTDYVKHTARSMMFSAAISPPNAAAALAAVRVMRREPDRLASLWDNTRRFRNGLKELGFHTGLSETPILPVRIGDTVKTFQATILLQEEGVFVNPVIAPAVPEGDALIRCSLMATHTFAHIDLALGKIEKVGRRLGVI